MYCIGETPDLFGNPTSLVFSLLTKILDANDWLSVQVHPDDAYGLEYEGELGKTECWYILSAEEGAEIIYGDEASTKEELAEMIEVRRWEDLLTHVPAKKGDFFFVPSATMHAIGKGITILKTQQSSDTTIGFMILTDVMIKAIFVSFTSTSPFLASLLIACQQL